MSLFFRKLLVFIFGSYGKMIVNWLDYGKYIRPLVTNSEIIDSINTTISGLTEFNLIDKDNNITKLYIENIVGVLDNYIPGTIYNPKERTLNKVRYIKDNKDIIRSITFLSVYEKIIVVDYIKNSHDVMFIHRDKILILPVEIFEEYFNINGDKIENNIIRLEL